MESGNITSHKHVTCTCPLLLTYCLMDFILRSISITANDRVKVQSSSGWSRARGALITRRWRKRGNSTAGFRGLGGALERDNQSGPVGRCRKRPLVFPSSVTTAAASLAPVAGVSFWRRGEKKRKRLWCSCGCFPSHPSPSLLWRGSCGDPQLIYVQRWAHINMFTFRFYNNTSSETWSLSKKRLHVGSGGSRRKLSCRKVIFDTCWLIVSHIYSF